MDVIKASNLQAAVSLTGALVLNDGKYTQWQKLFGKQLNAATGLKWVDNDWSEFKEGETTVHTLTFSCKATLRKKMVNIIVYFDETASGYVFTSCEVVGIGSPAGKPIVKTNSGNELIADIGHKLVQMGAISAEGSTVSAPAFDAPDAKLKKQAMDMIAEVIGAIKAGQIGIAEATKSVGQMMAALGLPISTKVPNVRLQDLSDTIALDAMSADKVRKAVSMMEEMAGGDEVSKAEAIGLLKKVEKNVGDWSVRDSLLSVGRQHIPNFDYVSLDEKTAIKVVKDLLRLVGAEEIDPSDIYDLFARFGR